MFFQQAVEILENALGQIFTEENRLDWKADISSKELRMACHLSAFANQQGGGFLVFGIDDGGNSLHLSQKSFEAIISKVGNTARHGTEPAVQVDQQIGNFRGSPILVIKVKESVKKPVNLKGKTIEHAYIRSAGQTRKMDRDEIRSSIVSSNNQKYELLPALTNLTEQEVRTFLDVDGYIALLSRTMGAVPAGLQVLKTNHLLEAKSAGKYDITNLGMLLCAQDFNAFGTGYLSVRVIKYQGTNKLFAISERVFSRGYALEFEEITSFVLGLLPHNEAIQEALRIQTYVYPPVALRELVANAIVHQLLERRSGSVLIEIFDDRIDITNPGRLLPSINIDQLINAHPESRNEILAKELRDLGMCEERGSGIDRAINDVEFYGLPPLDFFESDNYFRATILGPKTYGQMTAEERVRACYQHCSLMYVGHQKMTNQTLKNRLKLSPTNHAQASRVIKFAIQAGKIRLADPQNKAKKYMYYVPYWA